MEKDQRDLLREFNAHNVRYLVVGGYAFSYYTQPRATKDLDVFIENSAENAALVFAALAKFGAPVAGMFIRSEFHPAESISCKPLKL
jgi:hypothetical protein